MKTLLLALALAAGVAHAASAAAVGRLVDLGVYDRTSQRALPVYRHDGRYYIAGEPGHRYQISLRNRAGENVMAVLSVDAVNAISGDTADWTQTGYVLDQYADTDVLGWRKSTSQVADFVFADFARSYAVRTGRPDNVGVIGVAVFRRQRAVTPVPPAPMDEVAPAAVAESMAGSDLRTSPSMAALTAKAMLAPTDGPLGTGHGPREDSTISYVDFERASGTPDEVITLYYDTRAHLIAHGVLPTGPMLPRRPEAFPNRFVPDPPTGDSR